MYEHFSLYKNYTLVKTEPYIDYNIICHYNVDSLLFYIYLNSLVIHSDCMLNTNKLHNLHKNVYNFGILPLWFSHEICSM